MAAMPRRQAMAERSAQRGRSERIPWKNQGLRARPARRVQADRFAALAGVAGLSRRERAGHVTSPGTANPRVWAGPVPGTISTGAMPTALPDSKPARPVRNEPAHRAPPSRGRLLRAGRTIAASRLWGSSSPRRRPCPGALPPRVAARNQAAAFCTNCSAFTGERRGLEATYGMANAAARLIGETRRLRHGVPKR